MRQEREDKEANVEDCEEISMWNLYKDMSFAAKCQYYERNKICPSDCSRKSKCPEVKSSSFLKKRCYEVKINVIHIQSMYLMLFWLVGFCGILAFVFFYL